MVESTASNFTIALNLLAPLAITRTYALAILDMSSKNTKTETTKWNSPTQMGQLVRR